GDGLVPLDALHRGGDHRLDGRAVLVDAALIAQRPGLPVDAQTNGPHIPAGGQSGEPVRAVLGVDRLPHAVAPSGCRFATARRASAPASVHLVSTTSAWPHAGQLTSQHFTGTPPIHPAMRVSEW